MQDEAAENEPVAPEDKGEDQDFTFKSFVWFLRFAIVAYLAWGAYFVWINDDELRLRFLHQWIRALHNMARILGTWALQAEAAYNETAALLH